MRIRPCIGFLVSLLVMGTASLFGQSPTDKSSLTQEGIGLFKQARYAEAKEKLSRAAAADPKDSEAKAYLGLTLNNYDRDYDKAVELLEAAVQLDPQSSRLHLWLGSVYASKTVSVNLFRAPSFAKKCRLEMEKGVALEPANAGARESLMQFYIQAPGLVGGSMPKAHEQAAAIAKIDPCRGLMAEAAIAIHEKDTVAAEADFRKAMSVDPMSGAPCNGLAYLLLGAGRTDEALVVFKRYVQVAPGDPNAHDSFAEGLLAAGRVDEALAEYQKALSLDPWFASSQLGAGYCYERMGNVPQTRAFYQRYVELVPKGRTSDEVREKLLNLRNKPA